MATVNPDIDLSDPAVQALVDLVAADGLWFMPTPHPHFRRRADMSGVWNDDSRRINDLVRSGLVAFDTESGRVWLTSTGRVAAVAA